MPIRIFQLERFWILWNKFQLNSICQFKICKLWAYVWLGQGSCLGKLKIQIVTTNSNHKKHSTYKNRQLDERKAELKYYITIKIFFQICYIYNPTISHICFWSAGTYVDFCLMSTPWHKWEANKISQFGIVEKVTLQCICTPVLIFLQRKKIGWQHHISQLSFLLSYHISIDGSHKV